MTGKRTPEAVCHQALLDAIEERLALCSDSQKQAFERIFPDGVKKFTSKKLGDVLNLIERSIAKEEERKTE